MFKFLELLVFTAIFAPLGAQKSCFVEPIFKNEFQFDRTQFAKSVSDLRFASNGQVFSLFGWFRVDEPRNMPHPVLRVKMKQDSTSGFTQINHDNFLTLTYDNSNEASPKLIISYLFSDGEVRTREEPYQLAVAQWYSLAYSSDYRSSKANLVITRLNEGEPTRYTLSLGFANFQVPQTVEVDFGCFITNIPEPTTEDLEPCTLATYRDFSFLLEYVEESQWSFLLNEYSNPSSEQSLSFDTSSIEDFAIRNSVQVTGSFDPTSFDNGIIFNQGTSLALPPIVINNDAFVVAPMFYFRFVIGTQQGDSLVLLKQAGNRLQIMLVKQPAQPNYSILVGLADQSKSFQLENAIVPNTLVELTVSVIKTGSQSYFYIKVGDQSAFSPPQGDVELTNDALTLLDSAHSTQQVKMIHFLFTPNSAGAFLERLSDSTNDAFCRQSCVQKLNVNYQQVESQGNTLLLLNSSTCLVCNSSLILDVKSLQCVEYCSRGTKSVENSCIGCQSPECAEIQQDLFAFSRFNSTAVQITQTGQLFNFEQENFADLFAIDIANARQNVDYLVTGETINNSRIVNFQMGEDRRDLQNSDVSFTYLPNNFYDVRRNGLQERSVNFGLGQLDGLFSNNVVSTSSANGSGTGGSTTTSTTTTTTTTEGSNTTQQPVVTNSSNTTTSTTNTTSQPVVTNSSNTTTTTTQQPMTSNSGSSSTSTTTPINNNTGNNTTTTSTTSQRPITTNTNNTTTTTTQPVVTNSSNTTTNSSSTATLPTTTTTTKKETTVRDNNTINVGNLPTSPTKTTQTTTKSTSTSTSSTNQNVKNTQTTAKTQETIVEPIFPETREVIVQKPVVATEVSEGWGHLGGATLAFIFLGLLVGLIGMFFKCPYLPYRSFLYQKFIQLFLISQFVAFWVMYNHRAPANLHKFLRKLYDVLINWHSIFDNSAYESNKGDPNYQSEFFATRRDERVERWATEDEDSHFLFNFALIILIQVFVLLVYIVLKVISIVTKPKDLQREPSFVTARVLPWFEYRILFTLFLIFTVECFVFIFLNWYRWSNEYGVFIFSLLLAIVYFIIMVALIGLTFVYAIPQEYKLLEQGYNSRWGFIYEALRLQTLRRIFQGVQYLHYAIWAFLFIITHRNNVVQGIVTLIVFFLFFCYIAAIQPPRSLFDRIEQIVTHLLLFLALLLMVILVIDWDNDRDESRSLGVDGRCNLGRAVAILLFILFLFNFLAMVYQLITHFLECSKMKKRHQKLQGQVESVGYFDQMGQQREVVQYNQVDGLKPDEDEEWIQGKYQQVHNADINNEQQVVQENINIEDQHVAINDEHVAINDEHVVQENIQQQYITSNVVQDDINAQRLQADNDEDIDLNGLEESVQMNQGGGNIRISNENGYQGEGVYDSNYLQNQQGYSKNVVIDNQTNIGQYAQQGNQQNNYQKNVVIEENNQQNQGYYQGNDGNYQKNVVIEENNQQNQGYYQGNDGNYQKNVVIQENNQQNQGYYQGNDGNQQGTSNMFKKESKNQKIIEISNKNNQLINGQIRQSNFGGNTQTSNIKQLTNNELQQKVQSLRQLTANYLKEDQQSEDFFLSESQDFKNISEHEVTKPMPLQYYDQGEAIPHEIPKVVKVENMVIQDESLPDNMPSYVYRSNSFKKV